MTPLDYSLDKTAKIKQIFTSLNRKFEEQETQRRATKLNFPYFDLTGFPIEQQALEIIPQERAHAARAIVFFKEGPFLRIGISEPDNQDLHKLLEEFKKKKYQLELYLVSQSALQGALQQYKKILPPQPLPKHEISVSTGAAVFQKLKRFSQDSQEIRSTSASELLQIIVGSAVTTRSSDIHLEPEKKFCKVRFRIDGVLQDTISLPAFLSVPLLSRIKLLAGLKLNVTNIPQDGHFSVRLDKDRHLDLRTSSVPAFYGESIVLRILGSQEIELTIEKIGLEPQVLSILYEELKKPNGMILTTGPTGSGKTTTLYTFLNFLNKPGVKIITLEDPIEYQLKGVIQTPIDRAAGMDFAKSLRFILRQDPDIIMVGEIRDYETAETAAQAAFTGHVVLSTLHTNDAAGAIPRLLDLGVKPVTLAPALNALIAQRLLRKICQNCKEIYRPTLEEQRRVKMILAQIPGKSHARVPEHLTFYHSRGCEKCHELGYFGRVGIFEVFVVDEKMEELIYKQASTVEIKKAAIAQGMLTMQQDGLLKALGGITDLSEIWRVTEE